MPLPKLEPSWLRTPRSRRRVRTGLILLALAVAVGLVPQWSLNAEAGSQVPHEAGANGATTVTLITGDTVQVFEHDGQEIAQARPGRGRDRVSFAVMRREGHLHVIPSDAAALVGQGRLDPGCSTSPV